MHELLGKTLGDFEILRELGRGGMGVVFEARPISLNRKVALKVLSGGLGLTGQGVQRYQREAEAAAKLHYSNIVPVYATGAQDDIHYYAMELIDGPSLDHVIRQLCQADDGQPSCPPASASENVPLTAVTGPYVAQSASPPAEHASSLSSSSLRLLMVAGACLCHAIESATGSQSTQPPARSS